MTKAICEQSRHSQQPNTSCLRWAMAIALFANETTTVDDFKQDDAAHLPCKKRSDGQPALISIINKIIALVQQYEVRNIFKWWSTAPKQHKFQHLQRFKCCERIYKTLKNKRHLQTDQKQFLFHFTFSYFVFWYLYWINKYPSIS